MSAGQIMDFKVINDLKDFKTPMIYFSHRNTVAVREVL